MNSAYWLFTVQEASDFLDITGTQLTAWLNLAIPGVTGWLEMQCNRQFIARAQTYEYIADGDEDTLILKHTPIVSITSFTSSGGGTFTSDDYHINSKTGVMRILSKLTEGYKYTIVYNGGYSASNLPSELKSAALWLLGRLYHLRKDSIWAVASRQALDGTVTFNINAMPDDIKAVISRYTFVQ